MAESLNVEAAHKLQSKHERLEIVEAFVLAIVAIATAWGGYQAAKWEGAEQAYYLHATEFRVHAAREEGQGAEVRLLDQSTFNAWLQSKAAGHDDVARLIAQRFSPEFKTAFDEWIQDDPLTTLSADPGPAFSDAYHNALLEDAEKKDTEADEASKKGHEARHIADAYVRLTVLLATVLFMVAIAQRFKTRGVRISLLTISGVLMAVAVVSEISLPRA